jgi:hypothetical protein
MLIPNDRTVGSQFLSGLSESRFTEGRRKPMPRSALIEELTMPELRELRPEVVLIPVGSTEQHAYHLPYGTDTWRVAEHCRRAAEVANAAGGRVVVMPAMPYGVNSNFTAFLPTMTGLREIGGGRRGWTWLSTNG